jgi:hypothetical protein
MNTETGRTHDTLDILHHVGVINTDLHILSERYEKLGFLLTPLSTPKIIIEPGGNPVAMGVGNRHAIFENNYLELLGIVDPEKWKKIPKEKLGPYNIDIPLKKYEGLHVMHFGTSHIELVKERLRIEDIQCSAIRNFERNVQTDKGEQIMKARTISFAPEMAPGGLLQIAQHDTPELVFQSRYMLHDNGALALTELIVCCENPKEYVSKYERITNHRGVDIDENYFIIDLGNSKIIVITAERLERMVHIDTPPAIPFMAAFTVETSDLQLTKNVLLKNGIAFTERNGRVITNAVDGGGCAVIFKSR